MTIQEQLEAALTRIAAVETKTDTLQTQVMGEVTPKLMAVETKADLSGSMVTDLWLAQQGVS